MTTIQPPTEAARFLSRLDSNWRMVVVGDKKTPTYWEYVYIKCKCSLLISVNACKSVFSLIIMSCY